MRARVKLSMAIEGLKVAILTAFNQPTTYSATKEVYRKLGLSEYFEECYELSFYWSFMFGTSLKESLNLITMVLNRKDRKELEQHGFIFKNLDTCNDVMEVLRLLKEK